MKRFHISQIVFILLIQLSFIHIISGSAFNETKMPDSLPITIIFDEAHLDSNIQYSLSNFNHENAMEKPLDIASQLDFNGDFIADFKLKINSKLFTSTYFNNIGQNNILIMTLLDKKLGSNEAAAIQSWVEAGGSILLATQPDYAGFGYSKVEETNSLLKKLQVYDMFHLFEFQDNNGNYNSDELFDDNITHQFNIDGTPTNPWDIVVTSQQFSSNSLGQSLKDGIDEVLIGVSSIIVNSSDYVGAYSWPESYSVSDVTGDKNFINEAIPWIAGTNLGKGKIMLLGSTFPISDWALYSTTLSFIDQLDNKRLWVNIIKWLAEFDQVNLSPSASITDNSTNLSSNSISTTTNATGFTVILTSTALSVIFFLRFKKRRNNRF